MKKILFTLLFIPALGFGQVVNQVKTTVVKPVIKVVVSKDTTENDVDEEYKERKFQGQEETPVNGPYVGMTDHEIYNQKLREKSLKDSANSKQLPKKKL